MTPRVRQAVHTNRSYHKLGHRQFPNATEIEVTLLLSDQSWHEQNG